MERIIFHICWIILNSPSMSVHSLYSHLISFSPVFTDVSGPPSHYWTYPLSYYVMFSLTIPCHSEQSNTVLKTSMAYRKWLYWWNTNVTSISLERYIGWLTICDEIEAFICSEPFQGRFKVRTNNIILQIIKENRSQLSYMWYSGITSKYFMQRLWWDHNVTTIFCYRACQMKKSKYSSAPKHVSIDNKFRDDYVVSSIAHYINNIKRTHTNKNYTHIGQQCLQLIQLIHIYRKGFTDLVGVLLVPALKLTLTVLVTTIDAQWEGMGM